MSARIVTSAVFKLWPTRTLVVQFPQLLPPDRCSHSRRLFSYFCNSSSSRQFQQRWPSLLAYSSRTSTLLSSTRCFSQKPVETSTTSTTSAAAKPILGTFQGLGIAEQVNQHQSESAAGGAGSDEEEEAKRKKEAEASWRAMK